MPVELCTILFINKRKIQPDTREAIIKVFESGQSFGVVEVERDEMDGIMCIPFTPIDQKALKKVFAPPKPAPVKKDKDASVSDAIADLVDGAKVTA